MTSKSDPTRRLMKSLKQDMAALRQNHRPLSMVSGVTPPYFSGDASGMDVETFIYELRNCAHANDWSDGQTVLQLAHYLDGNAGYAFRNAVTNKVRKHTADAPALIAQRSTALTKKRSLADDLANLSTSSRELAALMDELSIKHEDYSEEENTQREAKLAETKRLHDNALHTYGVQSQALREVEAELKTLTGATTVREDSPDHPTMAFPTLELAVKWLRDNFSREDMTDELTGDYFGRRQKRGERVQDFAMALLALWCQSGVDVSESKKAQHFLDGLRPRLKRAVKHFMKSGRLGDVDDRDWDEVLIAAKRVEREHPHLLREETSGYDDDEDQAFVNVAAVKFANQDKRVADRADNAVANALADTTAALKALTMKADAQAAQLSALQQEVNRAKAAPAPMHAPASAAPVCSTCGLPGHYPASCPRLAGPGPLCYNCNLHGHMAWQCPAPATATTMRNRNRPARQFRATCYNCNELGHYAPECPNVAKANAGEGGNANASGQQQRGSGSGRPSKRPYGQGRPTNPCPKCGDPGHWGRDCPSAPATGANAVPLGNAQRA